MKEVQLDTEGVKGLGPCHLHENLGEVSHDRQKDSVGEDGEERDPKVMFPKIDWSERRYSSMARNTDPREKRSLEKTLLDRVQSLLESFFPLGPNIDRNQWQHWSEHLSYSSSFQWQCTERKEPLTRIPNRSIRESMNEECELLRI